MRRRSGGDFARGWPPPSWRRTRSSSAKNLAAGRQAIWAVVLDRQSRASCKRGSDEIVCKLTAAGENRSGADLYGCQFRPSQATQTRLLNAAQRTVQGHGGSCLGRRGNRFPRRRAPGRLNRALSKGRRRHGTKQMPRREQAHGVPSIAPPVRLAPNSRQSRTRQLTEARQFVTFQIMRPTIFGVYLLMRFRKS